MARGSLFRSNRSNQMKVTSCRGIASDDPDGPTAMRARSFGGKPEPDPP